MNETKSCIRSCITIEELLELRKKRIKFRNKNVDGTTKYILFSPFENENETHVEEVRAMDQPEPVPDVREYNLQELGITIDTQKSYLGIPAKTVLKGSILEYFDLTNDENDDVVFVSCQPSREPPKEQECTICEEIELEMVEEKNSKVPISLKENKSTSSITKHDKKPPPNDIEVTIHKINGKGLPKQLDAQCIRQPVEVEVRKEVNTKTVEILDEEEKPVVENTNEKESDKDSANRKRKREITKETTTTTTSTTNTCKCNCKTNKEFINMFLLARAFGLVFNEENSDSILEIANILGKRECACTKLGDCDSNDTPPREKQMNPPPQYDYSHLLDPNELEIPSRKTIADNSAGTDWQSIRDPRIRKFFRGRFENPRDLDNFQSIFDYPLHWSFMKLTRFGNNMYGPIVIPDNGLRLIVIDGSNVAMGHAQGRYFSVEGLKICIDFFISRGHVVKAFVPQYRLRRTANSNPPLLNMLKQQNLLAVTPSRALDGVLICPYDDRYVVQYASAHEAIIVSSDHYRDLLGVNPYWTYTIRYRLLIPTWIGDVIMFPPDPLGKYGPSLDNFLQYP